MTEFDVEFARRQFPQLDAGDGVPWAFFENAGGALAPTQVTGKLQRFFEHTKVQPYYPYGPSEEAGAAMDRSQRLLAGIMNARAEEIHFGPSTTMNVYVLAHALREQMSSGDELIITNQDHEANIGAWHRLEKTGIVAKFWQADPVTGLLSTDDLAPMLNDRTRLVCVNHCSNIVGQINPVRAIADMVHDAGARIVVDGVSFAPHAVVDVRELDVDYYLYSLYKTYGPHLGLMYVREELLSDTPNQGHFFNVSFTDKRLVPAGPDHGEIACASGIVDYYDALYEHHWANSPADELTRARSVFGLFAQHEQSMARALLEFLSAKPSVRLIGSANVDDGTRAPTVSFISDKTDNETIVRKLARHSIGSGYGNFYAYRLMERLGLDPESGVTRLSIVHYNTDEELARAMKVLDEVL